MCDESDDFHSCLDCVATHTLEPCVKATLVHVRVSLLLLVDQHFATYRFRLSLVSYHKCVVTSGWKRSRDVTQHIVTMTPFNSVLLIVWCTLLLLTNILLLEYIRHTALLELWWYLVRKISNVWVIYHIYGSCEVQLCLDNGVHQMLFWNTRDRTILCANGDKLNLSWWHNRPVLFTSVDFEHYTLSV